MARERFGRLDCWSATLASAQSLPSMTSGWMSGKRSSIPTSRACCMASPLRCRFFASSKPGTSSTSRRRRHAFRSRAVGRPATSDRLIRADTAHTGVASGTPAKRRTAVVRVLDSGCRKREWLNPVGKGPAIRPWPRNGFALIWTEKMRAQPQDRPAAAIALVTSGRLRDGAVSGRHPGENLLGNRESAVIGDVFPNRKRR